MTGHSDIRKTIQKVKEIVFWDNMIKDITKHVQECLPYQKERSSRKLGFGQEIDRSEEV